MKFAIISGSFFAGLTVILGAFGAHALKDQLSDYSKIVYDKAIFYLDKAGYKYKDLFDKSKALECFNRIIFIKP